MACERTQVFQITVYPTLGFSCNNPPAYKVGEYYDHPLLVAGGVGPFTYALIEGSLPNGLSLVGNRIVGIPTSEGTFTFNIRATDSLGTTDVITCSLSGACPVVTRNNPPSFSGLALPIDIELYLRNALNDEGTVPADKFYLKVTDTFIVNGTNPSVTLNQTPNNNHVVFVFVNGALQYSPENYTVVGTTYTLVGTFNNDNVKIVYWT